MLDSRVPSKELEKTLGKLVHIGFVVNDVEESMKSLADIGIKPWIIKTWRPPLLNNVTVRGKNAIISLKTAAAQVGQVEIELLSPLEGKSVYSEHLKQKGEGFHHIAMAVPTEEDAKIMVKKLEDGGGQVIQSGRMGASAVYYYVDMKKMGLVLEVSSGGEPSTIPTKIYP